MKSRQISLVLTEEMFNALLKKKREFQLSSVQDVIRLLLWRVLESDKKEVVA